MANLSPSPKLQFFDANGNPLAGGKLYTYAAGTTTPLATYTDSSASVPNTNPVILDSRGEAEVWLGVAAYKFKLTTSTDVEVWTVDDVVSANIQALADLSEAGGSALVGFLQAGTGAVTRTVQSKLRDVVSVKDFGAVGDGVADDTAAIQLAFNSGKTEIYFPEGTYLFSNLTIPNSSLTLYGAGYWGSRLKCSNPSNTTYGIASSNYVNNGTSGNAPITIRNLVIDGNNLVTYPLVIYGYYSELNSARVVNAKTGGYALLFTSNGISGSACTTTLVENKIINCKIDGGNGDAFVIIDTGARCTDMIVQGNFFMKGAVIMTSMAGHLVTNNHFYAGSVAFNKLSTGTVISNNYFENAITLDDFRDDIVGLSGNRFLGRVSVNFGNSGKTAVFDGCIWQGTADLYHNYFASDKRAVVNGGGFETASPVVFHNGGSTGWVSFNNVFSYSNSLFWNGSRQAAVGSIRLEYPVARSVSANFADSSATLTWPTSAQTNIWSTNLFANRTVTLSSTNAVNGARFRIVRSGGGAFTLDVGGLKTLSTGQWCDVEHDGTNWFLSAFGSL